MHFYVYHIHHTSGLSYVGSRTSKLPPERDTSYWGSGIYIKEARARLRDGWTKTIIDTYPTHAITRMAEDAFIWLFFGTPGNLNIKPKSSGCSGWKMSEQGKRNVREGARKRAPMSDETRAKMSAKMKGRKQTPAHIEARRQALAKSEVRQAYLKRFQALGTARNAAKSKRV